MVFLLPKPASYRMALRELNSSSRLPLWPASASAPPLCQPIKPARQTRLLSVHAAQPNHRPKRVGVVGGGTAGLGALIGILDVPEKARAGWEVELLERRADVGGLWNKAPGEVAPPVIPASPAYPLLHTNTVSRPRANGVQAGGCRLGGAVGR